MTANFSVDCTCGQKVVIDSDTMRKAELVPVEGVGGSTQTAYFGAPTRRVFPVTEMNLEDWDPEGDAA